MIKNSSEWFQANGFFDSALTTIIRKKTKPVHYNQIEGDMAHCSIFDRNHNVLVLNEAVINGGTYKLIRFGDDIFLETQGIVHVNSTINSSLAALVNDN